MCIIGLHETLDLKYDLQNHFYYTKLLQYDLTTFQDPSLRQK
jgi:hypothetical protein